MQSLISCNTKVVLNAFIAISIIVILYYTFLTDGHHSIHFISKRLNIPEVYHVWLIFTKVHERSSLKYKFYNLLVNILSSSSVPLQFNIIADNTSKQVALEQILKVIQRNITVKHRFYDFDNAAHSIEDIVDVMTPHFSSKPGTYYSDALFYLSLGLYRIAPKYQDRVIMVDCDVYFKDDIALLFREFNSFGSKHLFGLSPEQTPVYRHVLHLYRSKHNTTFGDYHPLGFPGYNSGVILFKLSAIRQSNIYHNLLSNESVYFLTQKYKFRGHLGDQDFYTLIGHEYPHLIRKISCGFNKQLCTWWRDHGYEEVFQYYFNCSDPVLILHGNCNTKIPKV